MSVTQQMIDDAWRAVHTYEKENFGIKFGPEFAQFVTLLRANKEFMSAGLITFMIATLEMSSLAEERKRAASPEAWGKDFAERPNGAHTALAEAFYVGYQVGKREAEVAKLETLAKE